MGGIARLRAAQEARRTMTLWKLSMVDYEFQRGNVSLDMKSAIKYYRDDGFEARAVRQCQHRGCVCRHARSHRTRW